MNRMRGNNNWFLKIWKRTHSQENDHLHKLLQGTNWMRQAFVYHWSFLELRTLRRCVMEEDWGHASKLVWSQIDDLWHGGSSGLHLMPHLSLRSSRTNHSNKWRSSCQDDISEISRFLVRNRIETEEEEGDKNFCPKDYIDNWFMFLLVLAHEKYTEYSVSNMQLIRDSYRVDYPNRSIDRDMLGTTILQ